MQWSEQGMASSYKFIQKLWNLHCDIKNKIQQHNNTEASEELEKYTNKIIAKITNNLEKFNYNVIIANMYETYNFLTNFLISEKKLGNLRTNYKKILICFSPVIPHFTNECLEDLNINDDLDWPDFDEKLLEEEEVNIVVQVNSRKRGLLKTSKNIMEKDLLEIVKKDKIINKYLSEKKIRRVIFIKNRLINILIDD